MNKSDYDEICNILSTADRSDLIEKLQNTNGANMAARVESLVDADLFDDLVAIVQYARRDTSGWMTMAAFDQKTIAEKYADNCSSDNSPWEYRVVDVEQIST